MNKPPQHAFIYSEAGVRLLEMDEDKAYELFVLAGNFALHEVLDNPAPPNKEGAKNE